MIESEYLRDNIDIIEQIKKIPTLELFEDQDLKELLKVSKIRKYKAGECIIEEGTFDPWVYFLLSGTLKILKKGKELSEIRRKGDIFGEMGVLDGSAKSASVYAIEDAVCLAINSSVIEQSKGRDRLIFGYVLYRIVAEILADRLRVTSEELVGAKEEIAVLKSMMRRGLRNKKE